MSQPLTSAVTQNPLEGWMAAIAEGQGSRRLNTLINGWGQQLLHKALSHMPHGCLAVIHANGQRCLYGNKILTEPTATLQVNNPNFYRKVLLYGHIGFGEAYMEGLIEPVSSDIKDILSWFLLNIDDSTMLEGSDRKIGWFNVLGWINQVIHTLRPNSLKLSKANIQAHYDLSNDFFALFLDPTMTYSSALFEGETAHSSLEAAQLAKIDSLLKGLRLKATDHLLEIGTGWGALAIRAVKQYGCHVTSITISQAQYTLAKQRIAKENLSDKIDVRLLDYRELPSTFGSHCFDKIVSVEMVEALGDAYMESFFSMCATMLKRNGLLGIQMITCPDSRYNLLKSNTDFIQKHIFPGSLLPSVGRVNEALTKTGDLSLFELKDMGLSYAKTLRQWHDNFVAQQASITSMGFDSVFFRKWVYYFQYCEAAFAMRNISVVQAIYTRPNNTSLITEN
ncbi:MAG: cyclopropane-fatty-acyl-phospholipid synthase [Vampirovibrionales bacterium]|nr:cyclopropane-fatty-acyl-phospholipid synthase [Vampirovibrionales bacterium]